MFDTVLVANRGEIAVRIFRTLEDLGIRSVAVYSDGDADSLHPTRADLAVRIGPAPAVESYLSIERVIEAARRTGAQAIHPGYGFLAENPAFARACAEAGITFIGPPPEAIEAMGDKIRAKRTVEKAGVPVVPGVHRPWMTDDDLCQAAAEVGYPLLVKAAAGGGGKGMRVVRSATELPDALAAARREAQGAFGDDALLLERYLERPRHIELQVFADAHGNVVHLGERECSLQRRHQKVIEECPSPAVDEGLRQQMGKAAIDVARTCGYVGAGTVEFIVARAGAQAGDGVGTYERRPPDGGDQADFFFLEMNTRLQVEHPVTEEVYDVDLVEWQLRVAAGEPLPLPQDELIAEGHAVEARVYAEDPARGFLPTGGIVLNTNQPYWPGIRIDEGLWNGMVIGSHYDPLLAKVVGAGPTRASALRRLRAALAQYSVLGVITNVRFLRAALEDPAVQAGRLDTGLLERRQEALLAADVPDEVFALAALHRLADLQPPDDVTDPFSLPTGWRVGAPAWATWRMRTGGRTALVRVRGTMAAAEVRVDEGPVWGATIEWQWGDQARVRIDGTDRETLYAEDGDVAWLSTPDLGAWAVHEEDELAAARHEAAGPTGGPHVAPMPGTVVVVDVAEGERVRAGQRLMVVEAMKMEHPITAAVPGIVTALPVRAGQQVAIEQTLAVVETEAGEEG